MCGCKERKAKVVGALRRKGWNRTARVVERIPSPGPDEETDRPRRTVVRGGPKRTQMEVR